MKFYKKRKKKKDLKVKRIFSKVKFCGLKRLPVLCYKKKVCFLISKNFGLLSSLEIEAARRVIRKGIGRSKRIKIVIRIYAYIPLTSKPAEVRMGRGKGSKIRKMVSYVKPGQVLFEIHNISKRFSSVLFKRAGEKLSINTKSIYLLKNKSLYGTKRDKVRSFR